MIRRRIISCGRVVVQRTKSICKMQTWRDVSPPFYCLDKVERRAPEDAADNSADNLLRASCCVHRTEKCNFVLNGPSRHHDHFATPNSVQVYLLENKKRQAGGKLSHAKPLMSKQSCKAQTWGRSGGQEEKRGFSKTPFAVFDSCHVAAPICYYMDKWLRRKGNVW